MSKVKEDLLKEIDEKIKRRDAIRKRTLQQSVESHVLEFIKTIEDLNAMPVNEYGWRELAAFATHALQERVRTIDNSCSIHVDWLERVNSLPEVNKVVIRWSNTYQVANNCDPELSVDIMSLLFK